MQDYMRSKKEQLQFVRENEEYLRNMVEYGMQEDGDESWLYNEGFIGKQSYLKIINGDTEEYQRTLRKIAVLLGYKL